MKDFLFIMFILELVLAGCRAQRSVKSSESLERTDRVGVELHRVDSLWSALAERLTYKIEFYPAIEGGPGLPHQAAPSRIMPATYVGNTSPTGSVGGGMGAVKSIEISTERIEDRSVITAVDSIAEENTATTETRQEAKTSEARQDNGTVATVAIVFAVATLIYLMIKNFMKS
jgi:hypothetical protein